MTLELGTLRPTWPQVEGEWWGLVGRSGVKKEWFFARGSSLQGIFATGSGSGPSIGSFLLDLATRAPMVVGGYGCLSRIGGSNLPGPISILSTILLGVWEDAVAPGSFEDL